MALELGHLKKPCSDERRGWLAGAGMDFWGISARVHARRGLQFQFPWTIGTIGRAALLRRRA